MRHLCITLIILLSLPIIQNERAEANECGKFPRSDFEDPIMRAFSEYYENGNYMFSVIIPKGLVGHDAPDPSPHHGFGIVLSWEPRAYIQVNSESNAQNLNDIMDVVQNHIEYRAKESDHIIYKKVENAVLGKLPAKKLILNYLCPNSKEERVEVVIVSFRENDSLVDEVGLDTTQVRYKNDYNIFMGIVNSWRVTGKY